MLELLLLLGTGLAGAATVGLTGITSTLQDDVLGAKEQSTKDYGPDLDAEGGEDEGTMTLLTSLLGQVGTDSGEDDIESADDMAGHESQMLDESDVRDHSEVAVIGEDEDADADDTTSYSIDDLMVALEATEAEDATSETVTESAGEAQQEAGTAEETAEDRVEGEDGSEEGVPVIDDFAAGTEQLVLMLPEGMDESATVSIEPDGEDSADAAVMIKDASGSIIAAIVTGAFGSIGVQDIVLMLDG